MSAEDQTLFLLEAWHGGDKEALAALLERELPWIRAEVRKRRGQLLENRADTGDYVHEAMIAIMRYGPRFLVHSRAQFRALLARMIGNMLVDQFRRARFRRAGQVETIGRESALSLDPTITQATQPGEAAARNEERSWLHLGIEFLESEDRKLIIANRLEGRSFIDLSEEYGAKPDALRMRCNRAVARLARIIERLKRGELDHLLTETEHLDQ